MSLQALREAVCAVNRALPTAGLVTMHSGNASGLDRASGKLVIKPSGIDYTRLTPDMLEFITSAVKSKLASNAARSDMAGRVSRLAGPRSCRTARLIRGINVNACREETTRCAPTTSRPYARP